MLTSASSQYLHPDYLQPLPTTLDAKKSPLALLAQTCSSIGKDSSPAKSIIPPIEKKDQKDKDRKSSSPGGGRSPGADDSKHRSSVTDKRDGSSPPNSVGSRDSPKSGFRAPAPKEIPALVPISISTEKSNGSDSGSKSSLSSSAVNDRDSTSVTSALPSSVSATGSSSGAQSNSRISLSCGNMLLEVNHNESANKTYPGLPASHPALYGLSKDSLTAPSALHAGLGSYPGLLGHHLPMDSSLYHQALSAHGLGLSAAHSAAQKAAVSAHGSALSPFVTYARVKTTAGATTLVPVCKDPYCTHCQMTMQSAQLATACAAGCTQCNHDKSPSYGVPTSLASASSLGGLPFLPPGSASSLALSSLYPHAYGFLPNHQGPYVCNWMAGSDYCGKRFATSEELLQHLRTHTSSGEMSGLHPGLAAAYSSLTPGLACHSHLTSPPGSLSPNSLRQGYPRSLSPNSLLVASRYHPYKSPLSSLPAHGLGSSTSGLPSALSAYYSPYSLYGQRLGAAVAP